MSMATLKLGMAFKTKKGTHCYLVGFVCGGNPLLRFDDAEEYSQSFQSLPLSYLTRVPHKDICEYFPQTALTTPPAPTVMGDATMEDIVSEITYHLNQARCIEKRTVGNHELASRIFENLAIRGYIRAATQPHGYDDSHTTNATSGTNTQPQTIYDMCEKCGYSYERGDQCSSCAAYKECDCQKRKPTTDAQRQEEKTCTCGAAGSGEGHTDWCDWLDVESIAVWQHVIEHGDSLDEFKSSVGIAVEACEKLAAIRDCDEPHQGNGQLKASALRQAASSLRYFANTVSSPNRNALPCETCKGNADSCADVPSLRHCEAANRESPQADAQRQAALLAFERIIVDIQDPDCEGVEVDDYYTVKAALQSPAVPRGLTALIHDADSAVRSAQTFINMSGQKDLNEIEHAMAWLNTAKENCIKALAMLGGKEG